MSSSPSSSSSIEVIVLSKLGQLFSMQWVCKFIVVPLSDSLKAKSAFVMSA